MICSKCFQNCNPFLNLEIPSLKKPLIPLTIILLSASAAMEAKPDPIYNHIATSKGITGSSITPLMPTSLGSKGDGNNRRWNFGNKSGLRHLLCYYLQHLTNDKQRDTRRVCFQPWPIGAIATSSTITESIVESLLHCIFILIAIVKYNTIIYKDNVSIILNQFNKLNLRHRSCHCQSSATL